MSPWIGIFQQAEAAVDGSGFAVFGEDRVGSGRSVERLDARAGGSDALGEGALRDDFDFELTAGEQAAGDAVGADETADEFADLAGGQQVGDRAVVTAAGVHDQGEIACALFDKALHQCGRCSWAEAGGQDGGAVRDVGHRRGIRVGTNL